MPLVIDRSLRLPDSQYFPVAEEKTGIALHHTVGGTAQSTFFHWLNQSELIGTAYLIARDGTVHEIFAPQSWAWQFGLPWPPQMKTSFEKRHIGIEIASEGGLIEKNGQLYSFDRITPKTRFDRNQAFDFGSDYRGYRYFARYTAAQLDALVQLVDDLCTRFNIPRSVPSDPIAFYDKKLLKFNGIIGHAMVRRDKCDPAPDLQLWQRLRQDCGLAQIDINTRPEPARSADTIDFDKLFQENMLELDKMNVAAGSMVKGLIMELQRDGRNTYIRLYNAQAGGHRVSYEKVRGSQDLIFRIARALGFARVTNTLLEVRHA